MPSAMQRLFHEVPAVSEHAEAEPARGLARPEETLRPPLPAPLPATLVTGRAQRAWQGLRL
ncbi:MAG TPA: hypothetical protein VE029_11935, partial [Rhizobacter sp.]|nr:hypothetical protein [Rhizobacter sp.]